MATLAGSAGYVAILFGWAGFSLPVMAWAAILGILASTFAFRNIRFSTGLMLALEVTSVLLVMGLGLAILFREGSGADLAQFRLDGVTMGGMNNALLIGVLSFVGFEASATLGDEAKDPLKTIPRALILTPLLTGAFFVFSAYVMVLGFNRYAIPVATSNAPLDDLARAMHMPGLGLIVSVGAAVSLFACGIATIVAASRLVYALAKQGSLPPVFGNVSGRDSAPKRAVATSAGIVVILVLALTSFAKTLDIYDWLGTFGTFGCITAYALTCVAAPVFLKRSGRLKVRHGGAALLALGVLGYVVFGSVYPIPDAPLNFVPWLFLGVLGGACAFSTWYSRRGAAMCR